MDFFYVALVVIIMMTQNSWSRVVLVVTILVYTVYIAPAWYTLTHLPPIPSEVVTQSGQVLFTGHDVVEGKILMQK